MLRRTEPSEEEEGKSKAEAGTEAGEEAEQETEEEGAHSWKNQVVARGGRSSPTCQHSDFPITRTQAQRA